MSLGIASRIFATIVPYTIEEGDEVADTIERGDKACHLAARSSEREIIQAIDDDQAGWLGEIAR